MRRRSSADKKVEDSIRGKQSRIESLLDSLSANHQDHEEFYEQIENLKAQTTEAMSTFQSNLKEMEVEFHEVLTGFKEGTVTTNEMEKFLKSEHTKGIYSLELADNVTRNLENIFDKLNDVLNAPAHPNKQSVNVGTIQSDQILEIAKLLDKCAEAVVGMARVTTSGPRQVTRAIHTSEMGKTMISECPDRGKYCAALDLGVRQAMFNQVEYQEPLTPVGKMPVFDHASEIEERRIALLKREKSIEFREAAVAKREKELEEEILQRGQQLLDAHLLHTMQAAAAAQTHSHSSKNSSEANHMLHSQSAPALKELTNGGKVTPHIAVPDTISRSLLQTITQATSLLQTNSQLNSRASQGPYFDSRALINITANILSFLPLAQRQLRASKSTKSVSSESGRDRKACTTSPFSRSKLYTIASSHVEVSSASQSGQYMSASLTNLANITSSGSSVNSSPASVASAHTEHLTSKDSSSSRRHHLNMTHGKGSPKPNLVETIVIYPINTMHKSTSCSDLQVEEPAPVDPGETVDASQAFLQLLSSSDNPLLLLYERYKSFLPSYPRSQLLKLSSADKAVSRRDSQTSAATTLSKLLTPVCEELEDLRGKVLEAEKQLKSCRDYYLADSLMAATMTAGDGPVYQATHDKVVEDTGLLSVTCISLLQSLTEYRTIFENLNTTMSSLHPNPLKSCPEFQKGYRWFLECQGMLLDINNQASEMRRSILKQSDRKHEDVNHSQLHAEFSENVTASRAEIERLHRLYDELRVQLDISHDTIEKLNEELFHEQQGNDKTPAALLYFSILLDESTIPTLQQVILQFTQFGVFLEDMETMDFHLLRQRLLVCVNCLPPLQNLIARYANIFTKWTQDRYRAFRDRDIQGIEPDSMIICPLCNSDTRLANPKSAMPPLNSSLLPLGRPRSSEGSPNRSVHSETNGKNRPMSHKEAANSTLPALHRDHSPKPQHGSDSSSHITHSHSNHSMKPKTDLLPPLAKSTHDTR